MSEKIMIEVPEGFPIEDIPLALKGWNVKEAEWMPDWACQLRPSQLLLLKNLCQQVICRDNVVYIDLGCFIGSFTKIMAEEARRRNGKLHSIDLFSSSTQGVALWEGHKDNAIKDIFIRYMKELGLTDTINLVQGCSWEYSNNFKNESVDLVFIDAEHKYESVKKDINSWYPKLKSGGIMAGHDYEFNEFEEQYINEDGHGDRHHGVIKAVQEFFGSNFNFKHTIWFHRKP